MGDAPSDGKHLATMSSVAVAHVSRELTLPWLKSQGREERQHMKVEIKGKDLVITIPMQEPVPSGSGKTLVIASTHGNVKTDVKVQGKQVTIGLNAYIKNGVE